MTIYDCNINLNKKGKKTDIEAFICNFYEYKKNCQSLHKKSGDSFKTNYNILKNFFHIFVVYIKKKHYAILVKIGN